MATNFEELRKRAVMDQYGMGLPDMTDPMASYGVQDDSYGGQFGGTPYDNYQSDDPTNRDGPPQSVQPSVPPDVPTYGATPKAPSAAPVDANDPYGIKKIMEEFYTPDNQSTDRLNRLMDQAPDYKNYHPGALRTIGAMGLSLGPGGFKGAEDALYSPMAREIAAWKEEAAPMQSAATLENQRNINERTLAGNVATTTVNARRADQTNATNEEKNQIARERNAIQQAKDNGAKFYTKGDRVIALFPDGTSRDAGPTSNWSPIELENLKSASALKVQESKNAGGLATQESRNAGSAATATIHEWIPVQDAQGNKFGFNPVTGEWKPSKGGPATPTGPVTEIGKPSTSPIKPQTKQERAGIATQIVNEDPSLAPYVKVGPTGDVQLTEPHATFFGAVPAALKQKFDIAKRKIYPETALPNAAPGTTVNIPTGGLVPNIGGPPAGGAVDTTGGGAVGKKAGEPWIQHSPSNPGVMRASLDGGKTWVYSNDGGKTWSRNEPGGGE